MWGPVWLLTIVGGGACGLVCAGYLSLVAFFLTIPVGMYLGAMLGLPLGLVIAIVVTRWATPPSDPVRLTRRLEAAGIAIGVVVTASINLYLAAVGSSFGDVDDRVLLGLAVIVNGLVAVLAVAVVGRACGHVLAARHLERFDLTAPARCSLLPPWSDAARS